MILVLIKLMVFIITCLYLYLRFRPLRWKMAKLPAVPDVNYFIGGIRIFEWKYLKHFPNLSEMINEFIDDEVERLNSETADREGIVSGFAGYFPLVVFTRPEYAEALLSSQVQVAKGYPYNLTKNWLQHGLVTAPVDQWRIRRKMLTSSFNFKILTDLIPIVNEKTNILLEIIEEKMQKDGFVADTSKMYLNVALDTLCVSAMGSNLDVQRTPTDYVQGMKDIARIIKKRIFSPFQWDFLYRLTPLYRQEMEVVNKLDSFTTSVIEKRKRELIHMMDHKDEPQDEYGRKRKLNFMDSLITEHFKNPSFTINDILEEVNVSMFAGHDTTGWSMTWATLLIGNHPEVQLKIQEELDMIFGPDLDSDITMEDLRQMKYMDMVIKECQRLFPAGPAFGRELVEDLIVKIDGKDVPIPSGVNVMISAFNVHRNRYIWDEPLKFDPERFSAENCTNRHPYAFLAFSAGPRNCIGQKFAILELKAMLGLILRRYNVTSLVKVEDVKLLESFVLTTKTPMKAKFERRIV